MTFNKKDLYKDDDFEDMDIDFDDEPEQSEQQVEEEVTEETEEETTSSDSEQDVFSEYLEEEDTEQYNDSSEEYEEATEEYEDTEEEYTETSEETSITSDDESQAGNDKLEEEKAEKNTFILYIITDKVNNAILTYYRNNGINLSRVFYNISEAKDTILMQVNPIKVLIADTGTGKFSAMGSRKEIIDLMGICDEDARISFFYTDTAIKSEVEYSESIDSKKIKWYKYKSNTDIVNQLIKSNETYIYDDDDVDNEEDVPEDVLQFTGLPLRDSDSIDLGATSITTNDLMIHMSAENSDGTDCLPKYEVKM